MSIEPDVLAEAPSRPPTWLIWITRLLPCGIIVQSLSAGLGLFVTRNWLGLHAVVGFTLFTVALGMLVGTAIICRLRFLLRWTGLVAGLAVLQVVLAAGGEGLPLALHPANGALLLCASIGLWWNAEHSTER